MIGNHLLVGKDFLDFYLPIKQFLYEELHKRHSIPLWNPFILGGMPFWAHFESTIFYPLGLLFWVIEPPRAYGYTMFIHVVLAGIFMYMLTRSFSIGRAGSLIASIIYTCNGFLMALLYLGHMSPIMSYAWLPIVIYSLNKGLKSRKPHLWACIGGLLWGVQILAGAPQDAFYTFLAAMFFLLLNSRSSYKKGLRPLNLSAIPFCFLVFGAGLSALQILPAFELINESVRGALDDYNMVTMASYPPRGLITLLMPHFFGNYVDGSYWVAGVPFSIPQQSPYVAILPLLLLPFLSSRTLEDRRFILFAGILALLALILALGRHTPVYKLAYLLPGFDRFRAPSKILVLWVFAMGLLAGKGVDGILSSESQKDRVLDWRSYLGVFLCIALVTIDVALRLDASLGPRFFSWFVLKEAIPEKMMLASKVIAHEFHVLTILSGFSVALIVLTRTKLLRTKLASVLFCTLLMANLSYTLGRAILHNDNFYSSISKIKQDLRNSLGRDKDIYRVGSFQSSLGPNMEMYFGFQTVGGFTALFPNRYYEYMNAYAEHKLPKGWVNLYYGRTENITLIDLLNVKYEIFHNERSFSPRESYLPRAFMVHGYEVIEKGKALERIVQKDFDPFRAVLFEKGDFNPTTVIAISEEPQTKSDVRILSYRPDEILLRVSSPSPGFLFLSEVYYPGWKCFLDGQKRPILRGNYLFRVIQVPEGTHELRMVFDPWTVKAGIALTFLTLFLFVSILAHSRLKMRKG